MKKRIYMITNSRQNIPIPIGRRETPTKRLSMPKKMVRARDHGRKKSIR